MNSTRALHLSITLTALLALFPLNAWAEDGDKDVKQTLSGALITNPVGLYGRFDHQQRIEDTDWWIGAFSTFLFYSNEFGLQLQYTTDPAWFEIHLDTAVEPGVFRKSPQLGQPTPEGGNPRALQTRLVARLQSNINLQFDYIWFYSRTTALFRYRNFKEDDTILKLSIEREYSLEQALAIQFRLLGRPESTKDLSLWIYGEYTVGGILDVGARPNRLSAGLISGNLPWDGTVLNLDLYYSFAEPIDGPGIIFAWWIVW